MTYANSLMCPSQIESVLVSVIHSLMKAKHFKKLQNMAQIFSTSKSHDLFY